MQAELISTPLKDLKEIGCQGGFSLELSAAGQALQPNRLRLAVAIKPPSSAVPVPVKDVDIVQASG
eukprot:12654074-Alexandrium_andersonii.AAC.1